MLHNIIDSIPEPLIFLLVFPPYDQLDNVHIIVYFMNVKKILFFRTESGKCPVEEHFNNLTDGQAASPHFSRVDTPDRQSVSRLSYTLVCETPNTAGYTDVSACPKGEQF